MTIQALAKGWTGELKTKLAQSLFLDLKEYHIFNNILVKARLGTTQIDHVIVSRYGIFVIETKNKDGWIYGKSFEPYWTQVFNSQKKFKFQNPLRQNYLHTQSLAEHLEISSSKMHSIIVFWGNCQFHTVMPSNVLNNNLSDYIKAKKQVLLTDGEVEKICRKLKDIKDNTSFVDGWRHMRMLKKRYEHN